MVVLLRNNGNGRANSLTHLVYTKHGWTDKYGNIYKLVCGNGQIVGNINQNGGQKKEVSNAH